MKFAPLVENEILKLLKRRRFRVALLILVALNGLIVFAQTQAKDRRPGRDWRIEAQERVARMQNWERSGRLPKTQLRWVRFEIARVQYHLDRNVNPDAISGPLFARAFAKSRAMSKPAIRTSPESGRARPTSMRIVVVLPAPFGPRNPNTSPATSSKETSETTSRFPNRFVRPWADRTTSGTGAWGAGS